MEVERIRFVTRVVADPTGAGLRLVPFGLWMLAAAGGEAGWWPLPDVVLVGAVLVVVPAIWAVHRYYQRTYGRVVAGKEACELAGGWLVKVGGVAALAVATAAEVAYSPDPSILGLTMSGVAAALVFLLYERPHRMTYAVGSTLLLLGVLLSPLVLPVPDDGAIFRPGGFLFDMYWGIAFTLGGLGDHVLLARTLRRSPQGQRA